MTMPNTREKLIELLDEAEEHATDICVFHDSCEGCPSRKYGNKCRDYLQADHLIAHGVSVADNLSPTEQKWIPVTERLPEVRVPVMTYGRKGAVGIGFTQPTSVTKDGKVYFYARYGDDLPTHWMPLPEPPEGE